MSLSPVVDMPGRTVLEGSEQTALDIPGGAVVVVRTVAHVTRVVAVLAVAVRATILAVELVWVAQGRNPLDGTVATQGLWLAITVGMAGLVWWLAAGVFEQTTPPR